MFQSLYYYYSIRKLVPRSFYTARLWKWQRFQERFFPCLPFHFHSVQTGTNLSKCINFKSINPLKFLHRETVERSSYFTPIATYWPRSKTIIPHFPARTCCDSIPMYSWAQGVHLSTHIIVIFGGSSLSFASHNTVIKLQKKMYFYHNNFAMHHGRPVTKCSKSN